MSNKNASLKSGIRDNLLRDESHNFRNDSKPRQDKDGNFCHTRYSRLLEEVIKEGTKSAYFNLFPTPEG